MIQIIYDTPPWLLGIVFIVFNIGLAHVGVSIISRIEPVDTRHTYNDIVGFIIAVIGAVYAVLLAWVAIAAWETYDKADAIVEREASTIGDMARLTKGLPTGTAAEARDLLVAYADKVVTVEWATMRKGKRPSEAWPDVENLQKLIVDYEPASPREINLQNHIIGLLTDLFDVRRDRLAMSEYGINRVVWAVILLGNFVLIGVSFMFGLEPRRHKTLCSFLSLSTALVIFMIVEMDRPFLGKMAVDSGTIEYVADLIAKAPLP